MFVGHMQPKETSWNSSNNLFSFCVNERTNVSVLDETGRHTDKFKRLVDIVRKRKLRWFSHVTRRPGTLAHTIMHCGVPGMRGRGRPRGNWLTDIRHWTGESVVGCSRLTVDRQRWRMAENCGHRASAAGCGCGSDWRFVFFNQI